MVFETFEPFHSTSSRGFSLPKSLSSSNEDIFPSNPIALISLNTPFSILRSFWLRIKKIWNFFSVFYPPTYLTPLNWYNSNVFHVDRMSNLSIKECRRIIKQRLRGASVTWICENARISRYTSDRVKSNYINVFNNV